MFKRILLPTDGPTMSSADEIMGWLGQFKRAPRRSFVTHGEPAAALRRRIRDCALPGYLQQVELS